MCDFEKTEDGKSIFAISGNPVESSSEGAGGNGENGAHNENSLVWQMENKYFCQEDEQGTEGGENLIIVRI